MTMKFLALNSRHFLDWEKYNEIESDFYWYSIFYATI